MSKVTWVHLSDFHMGHPGEDLRGEIERCFFDNFNEMAEKLGSKPDFVLVTGDITNRAAEKEFDQFQKFVENWADKCDFTPLIIPVPGNHDVQRPSGGKCSPDYTCYQHLNKNCNERSEFLNAMWGDAPDRTRVVNLFGRYTNWFQKKVEKELKTGAEIFHLSDFPGDFSLRRDFNGKKVGIVGLNSSWMHIDDDAEGKLELPLRQYNAALPHDISAADFHRPCALSFLILHHPENWFSPLTREDFRHVFNPKDISLLCHGHLHENTGDRVTAGAGETRRRVQCASFYGRDKYGTNNEERRFGYAWGRMEEDGEIRIWPLECKPRSGDYSFGPDSTVKLGEDNASMELRSGGGAGSQACRDRIQHQVPNFQKDDRLNGAMVHARILGFNRLTVDAKTKAAGFLEGEIERLVRAFGPGLRVSIQAAWCSVFFPSQMGKEPFCRALLSGLHLLIRAREAQLEMNVALHEEHEGGLRSYSLNGQRRDYFFSPKAEQAKDLIALSSRPQLLIWQRDEEDYLRGPSLDSLLEQAPKGKDLKLPDPNWQLKYSRFNLFDEHKVKHEVVSIYLSDRDDKPLLGDPASPQERVGIEYRPQENVPAEERSFFHDMVRAEELIIAGITHENLVTHLKAALNRRGGRFWKRLRIIFPDKPFLDRVMDQRFQNDIDEGRDERQRNWEAGRQRVTRYLNNIEGARERWECLRFPGNLPFVGQWFKGERDSIRIAPILPGVDQKNAYYMEVFEGSHVYELLSEAFGVIVNQSRPIVEWVLVTTMSGDDLVFKGICNRKHRRQVRETLLSLENERPVFPVVLVMLHMGRVAVLQTRTAHNATSGFNTKSNISGRLNDEDLYFAAKGGGLDTSYLRNNYSNELPNDQDATFNLLHAIDWKITQHHEIPSDLMDRVWRTAAVRELREELGLFIHDWDRLEEQKKAVKLEAENGNGDYLFRIFSLEIEHDELNRIRKDRPHSELRCYPLQNLRSMYQKGELNALLQNKFNDVFIPIYQELGIR